jgi:hypothetical protein
MFLSLVNNLQTIFFLLVFEYWGLINVLSPVNGSNAFPVYISVGKRASVGLGNGIYSDK